MAFPTFGTCGGARSWPWLRPAFASSRPTSGDLGKPTGQTIEAYDISQSVGDMVGLMAALGETSAVIVGHDLGAWVAQAAAMMRPDLFRGLVMLNTPVPPRGKVRPTVALREMAKGRVYHHLYFQEVGKPDRELAARSAQDLAQHLLLGLRRAPSAPSAGACSSSPASPFSTPSPSRRTSRPG